jgi:hypothetical protein
LAQDQGFFSAAARKCPVDGELAKRDRRCMIVTIKELGGNGRSETSTENGTLSAFGLCRMKKCCFVSASVILVLLATAFAAGAASYCVGPSATGSGSGADWNNLKAWSGTPVRGDSWYLVGGSYASKTFSVAASGTTLITIKKATAANYTDITATGWTSAMANQATFSGTIWFNTSYWVFDGQTHGTGIWSRTAGDYGFYFPSVEYALKVYSTSITLSNVTMSNIYGLAPSGDVEKFFVSTDNSSLGVNNVTISYCAINGYQNAFWATSAGLTMGNWIFEYNVCFNGFGSSANHGEWLNNNYGYMVNAVARFNEFDGPTSGFSAVISVANNNSTTGWQIYGNVFENYNSGNGIIAITSSGMTAANMKVYNNTFYNCMSGWIAPSGSGYTYTGGAADNNLFYDMSVSGAASGVTADYGAYYSCSGNAGDAHIVTGSGNPFNNLASGDFTLAANTTAGENLGSPYNVDPYGTTRTTWTRGAFEFGGTSTNAIISVSPSTLNFGTVSVGTASNLTFTVKNVGAGTLAGTADVATPFSIVSGGSYSLSANQAQTVTVEFTPLSAVGNTNSVTFTGGGGMTASVSGEGITVTPPPPPDNLHLVVGP